MKKIGLVCGIAWTSTSERGRYLKFFRRAHARHFRTRHI